MPTNYPTSLDDNTKLPVNYANGVVYPATTVNNQNGATQALEAKLGIGNSSPTTVGYILTVTATGVTAWASAASSSGYAPGGTDVAIADGGTGASTAGAALTNLGAAARGANSDITSLTGLTTPLAASQGGTGSTTGRTPDTIATGSFSSTITPNLSTSNYLRATLTGNVTVNAPTGTPADGQRFTLEFIQDGTGSRTITLSSDYYIPSTLTAPVLGTAAGALNVVGVRYNAQLTKWVYYGVI